MSDIDQIIASGAKTNANFDFNSLINVPARQAEDELYKRESRELFKDGYPRNEDGSINWGKVSAALIQHGDVGGAVSTENTDIARQQLRLGAEALKQSQGYETGQPPLQPSFVSPPSPNRSASTPVAPPLNRGGVDNQAPGGRAGGTSIMQILAAQGIPNDQLQAASASVARQIGVDDPTQPIDINDPRVRNVLVPAVQQLKRAGVGRVIPEGEPSPPDQALAPQVIGSRGAVQPNAQGVYPSNAVMLPDGPRAPVMAQGAPTPVPAPPPVAPQGQPGPVTNSQTGTTAPAVPSRVEQGIALYSAMAQNPGLPASTREAAKIRLQFLQKQQETTPEQKNYIQAKLEGFPGTMADFAAKTEADKAYATENTKSYIKKYDAIQTAGERARQDIPQLELARELTHDKNFYSGVGEKYNLFLKRAITALGGDPDTAAPQEAFRKVVSNSILDQIKGLAGTGQIRVAEIRLMEQAAANAENTPQANRLLLELSTRLQKRSAAIADMAQSYNGGRLDSGFDRKVAAYDRANPLISDREIPDFRKIIAAGGKKEAATTAATNPYEAEMRRRGLLK